MAGHLSLIIATYTVFHVMFLQQTSNTNKMPHEHRCCSQTVLWVALQHRLVSTHIWCTVHGSGFEQSEITPHKKIGVAAGSSIKMNRNKLRWETISLSKPVLDGPCFWVFLCIFPSLAQIIGVVLYFEATSNECPLEWAFVWILWS